MGDKEKKKVAWKDIGISKLLIMLFAGILLILISFADFSGDGKKSGINQDTTVQQTSSHNGGVGEITLTEENYAKMLQERLKSTLALAKNVGKVEVMITLKASGEKIILVEKERKSSVSKETDSQGGNREVTEESHSEPVIYIKGSDGSMIPYTVKETMPEIEGVVVIAEGGGDSVTVSNIIDAVMALFDVPIHKIKVLEMK